MTLLIIAYLLLLYVEIFGEVLFGDKHDLKSTLRLVATLGLAVGMGLLAGHWYGVVLYLLIRVILFDISFGYLFKGDMWYLGTTSKWDINKRKLINKLKKNIKMKNFLKTHLTSGKWLFLLFIICAAILLINVPSTPKGALTVGIPILVVLVGGSKLFTPLHKWLNK